MDLGDLNINLNELITLEDMCIFRNEHAYIVFKLAKENDEFVCNCLLINDKYYHVKTLENLRTYKSDDFD